MNTIGVGHSSKVTFDASQSPFELCSLPFGYEHAMITAFFTFCATHSDFLEAKRFNDFVGSLVTNSFSNYRQRNYTILRRFR